MGAVSMDERDGRSSGERGVLIARPATHLNLPLLLELLLSLSPSLVAAYGMGRSVGWQGDQPSRGQGV